MFIILSIFYYFTKRRFLSQLLDDEFLDALNVSSARECTGLMPSLPQSEAELESYKSLFSMEVNSLDTLKEENLKKEEKNIL